MTSRMEILKFCCMNLIMEKYTIFVILTLVCRFCLVNYIISVELFKFNNVRTVKIFIFIFCFSCELWSFFFFNWALLTRSKTLTFFRLTWMSKLVFVDFSLQVFIALFCTKNVEFNFRLYSIQISFYKNSFNRCYTVVFVYYCKWPTYLKHPNMK